MLFSKPYHVLKRNKRIFVVTKSSWCLITVNIFSYFFLACLINEDVLLLIVRKVLYVFYIFLLLQLIFEHLNSLDAFYISFDNMKMKTIFVIICICIRCLRIPEASEIAVSNLWSFPRSNPFVQNKAKQQ